MNLDELRQDFSYCPETGELIRHYNGRSQPISYVGNQGYLTLTYRGKQLLAHRIIWALLYGASPENIDHINGERSDNRLSNLRASTIAGNARNRRPQPNKLYSAYKGVTFGKRGFRARINFNGRSYELGYFATELEAALAYNRKASEIFGDFAWLNPLPLESE